MEGYVEIDIGGLPMKRIKLIIAALLTLALTVGMFAALGGEKAQAATKPAKAKVTAKANDDGTSVTLTIAKTKKAQGYQIMVKKPGAKKFTKLATISEDGTAKRTYTAKKLTEGDYQFKVRAYLKNGKKTVWGKYSKVTKVTVKAAEKTEDTGKDDGSVKYIFTQKELAAIEAKNKDAKYVLKNDIDMTGWTPLEIVYCSIDGAGHTLKNLTVPFIAQLAGGTVENFIFDVKMTTIYEGYADYKLVAPIAFLCGGNNLEVGTVKNCKTTGSIETSGKKGYTFDYEDRSEVDVGGIVAKNPNNLGYIERCVNEASITVKDIPRAYIGGIAGEAGGGTVRDVLVQCKNAGNISGENLYVSGIGGICGAHNGLMIIKDCLNTGSVKNTGYGEEYPRGGGGISGSINSPIMENCVSLGASDYAIAGYRISAQVITNWSYSSAHLANVYYAASIGDGFFWEGNPVEVEGTKAVSDITDKSAFAGPDFTAVWKMGENGPELRNIP